MAQSETAETHDGTIDGAVDALANFDFDEGTFAEEKAEEAPQVEASEDGEEVLEEDPVEEELTEEEPEVEAKAANAEVIDAPVSWSDEQKEVFSSLPPEAQSVIVAREGERDKGFQQKATEVAEQKRQYEAAMTQLNHERQQYAQNIRDEVNQGLVEPDIDLLVHDPARYRDEKIAYDQMIQLRNQATQQADYYAAENMKQEQEQRQGFYHQRNGELAQALPAFIQDAQYRDGVLEYAKQAGYADSELEMARSADIVILDKAQKYDALMANKTTVRDKLTNAPKVIKPGARQEGNPKTRAAKANLQSHKKNGNVHSAAKLLEGLF